MPIKVFNMLKDNFADHSHKTLSKNITSFAERIDNFFGTERSNTRINKTRIRIYVDTLKQEGKKPYSEGNIKLQLALPRTQDRLQFILESEDDSDKDSSPSRAQRATGRAQTEGEKARDSTTAGFRYIMDSAGLKSSIGTGVLFDAVSPRPFYRFRIFRDAKFGKWLFRPQQELFFVSATGHSTDTDLDLNKILNDTWSFRFVNNIQWNDTDYMVNFQNGPTWFQQINEKIAMSYSAHVFTSNQPAFEVSNYSLSVGFRQLLYKNWFFWTLTPALNFPRLNNFHRTPSLSVRFETIIGHI
jgi:hypothetical protein